MKLSLRSKIDDKVGAALVSYDRLTNASFHVSGAVAFSKDLVFDATMDVGRTKDDDNNCIELSIKGSKTLLDLAKSVGARDLNTCRSAIQAKLSKYSFIQTNDTSVPMEKQNCDFEGRGYATGAR